MMSSCGLFAVPNTDNIQKADTADAHAVRATFDSILMAARVYYQDKGEWPDSVSQLIGYTIGNKIDMDHPDQDRGIHDLLTIPSAIDSAWNFTLEYKGPPSLIRATAKSKTYRFEGDNYPIRLWLNVATGEFIGDGVPVYHRGMLTPDQQAELACDAIGAIWAIHQSSSVYYNDKGVWPESPEILTKEKYMELSSATSRNWSLGYLGTVPQMIIAVSTLEMPDGAGHTIMYDVQRDLWRGYGLSKLKDSIKRCSPVYVEYVDPKAK
jgi:hypothetical protein